MIKFNVIEKFIILSLTIIAFSYLSKELLIVPCENTHT